MHHFDAIHNALSTAFLMESACLVRRRVLSKTSTNIMNAVPSAHVNHTNKPKFAVYGIENEV
jgi:hypothetical protein